MALVTLVFFAVGVAGVFAQFPPGGFGETGYVDAYTRQVVFSVKDDIVRRLNNLAIRVNDFQPTLFRSRAATGTVYLVKIRIDYGRYIHVTIYRHFSGTPTEVQDIEVGKTLADPLV